MHGLQRLIASGLLAGALPALAAAQGTGSGIITGRVVGTQQQPIAAAQVYIVSTQNGSRSDDEGRYRIVNVAPGTYLVRATRIGYEAAAQTITVAAGQSATLDFTMTTASVTLDAVVTTATGEQQRKRETGNSVATIDVADIPRAATPNMASLLSARAPGVQVIQAGGTTGTSQRVRIRGANSVNLNNEPLLIIDGVRVDNGNALTSFSIGVGGQTTSRLNDVNFEDIENLEILKGPAASALYGTAAANGVIQITTKRGRAGATRWTTYAEQGTLTDPTNYPYNYGNFNRQYSGVTCFLADQYVPNPLGGCSADSIAKFSPLKADNPFRTGYHQRYGASAGGGTDAIQYFLSADFEQENGIYRNNGLQQLNLRSNVNTSLRPDLNTGVTIGYVSSDLQLPQNDNNNLGILGGFLLGSAVDNAQHGYITRRPDSLYFLRAGQGVERFTIGANPVYTPLSWLRFNATLGYDVLNRDDHNVLPPNRITNNTNNRIGYRTRSKYQVFNYTANASGTATKSVTPDLVSTTTIGAQFQRDNFTSVQALGRNLLAGTGSLAGTASNFAIGEDNIDTRTLGFLASEQIGLSDRVFLTGTLRGDKNSSFGTDFGFVNYPSASLSYVISEEPFFPKTNWVSSLRLRSAYGQSGVQPGARDALVYYNPDAVAVNGVETAGFTIAGLGRKDLRPEVSAEFEAGFEAGFGGDRASVEATFYNKKSRDALISRNLPPSAGTVLTRFENIGSVQNKGIELGVNGSLVRMDNLAWDATVNASWNQNKLIKLGAGVDPILFGLGGDTQKHIAGKPLGSYYQRPVYYNDANHNGVIEYDEYSVGDTAVYLGNPLPKREISVNTTLILHKWVKLYALLDHKGGFYNYNATEDFRCGTFAICQALYVPGTPLRQQAAALADLNDNTVGGYIEKADFVKLREVAVTLVAPADWARRARTRELSLTLSGRNLHTWTRYTGFDPEVLSSTTGNFSQSDFLTQPPVRFYTVRLNANF